MTTPKLFQMMKREKEIEIEKQKAHSIRMLAKMGSKINRDATRIEA